MPQHWHNIVTTLPWHLPGQKLPFGNNRVEEEDCMPMESAQRHTAAELRQKARQYRALALSLDNKRAVKLALDMGYACDARAQQIELELISHAA